MTQSRVRQESWQRIGGASLPGVRPTDYAAQTLADNNYKWREFDPEDTIRWYALRLRETGLIKSTPQQIIANAADWRFLDELKRELKA